MGECQIGIPEEAVEDQAQILFGRMMRERGRSDRSWHEVPPTQQEQWRAQARRDVEAAANAIRKQERERWMEERVEAEEDVGSLSAELKNAEVLIEELKEARDLCKNQTAEANKRHDQTKEVLKKAEEAWGHERDRADRARKQERERVQSVIAAARYWLQDEYGPRRPSHPADRPAADLFDALENSDAI